MTRVWGTVRVAQSGAGKGGDGRLSGKGASEEKEDAWYTYTYMFICRKSKTTTRFEVLIQIPPLCIA